jgi:ElaB/YqjD/DUF883 family membrane-anchored ribosome-binding protein
MQTSNSPVERAISGGIEEPVAAGPEQEQQQREPSVAATDVEQSVRNGALLLLDDAEDRIRNKPWQSLGIAAGVGLLIGWMIHRH